MKRTCLIWIGLYLLASLVLAAGMFLLSPPDSPWPFRAAMAVLAAMLGAIPVILALGAFDGLRLRLTERRDLLSAARRRPVDGAYQAFTGRIVSDGTTLEAPLTGRPCVAYRYSAAHRGGGRTHDLVVDAEGFAMVPCRLDTDSGPVRLLSFVELESQGDIPEEEDARARLRGYLASVKLYEPSLDLMENYRRSQEYLLDSDGSVRFDHGFPEAADRARHFEERIVGYGDEVVVFGFYSAERAAIVPDPREEILHRAKLRKGSPRVVARGLLGLGIGSLVAGVLSGLAAWWWVGYCFRNIATGW